jgi:two-component system, LytTR family, response regulator
MSGALYKCVVIDDDEQSRRILEHYISTTDFLTCVAAFGSSKQGLAYLLTHRDLDILYLDIDMPELTGIELLKALPRIPATVLTTSHTDFALTAFELQASDYLVKPFDYPRFAKSAANLTERLKAAAPTKNGVEALEEDDVFIKVNNRMVRISTSDILHVEALNDYVLVTTDQRQYIVDTTMRAIEEKLPDDRFARIHRSFIVNLKKIEAIEDNSVIIKGKFIPISRTYQPEFYGKIKRL